MNESRKEHLIDTILYRLPRSRLRLADQRLDWVDDYDSLSVDSAFCTWLANYYQLPAPWTDEIVASDPESGIHLYRWNASLGTAMTGGDPDVFDGIVGGDAATEPVTCCETWMTQRQAWKMWDFFRAAIRDGDLVVEFRL